MFERYEIFTTSSRHDARGKAVLLGLLAAGTTLSVGQVFKLGSRRYLLFGISHFGGVDVSTGAFHLCHSRNDLGDLKMKGGLG